MKKLFLLFFVSQALLAYPQKTNWFSIKAFLPRWNGADVALFSDNQLLYTGKVIKDIFSYTGTINSSSNGLLKINSGKIIFYIPVFLEPGTIKVRDAGGRIIVAFGTSANDLYTQLNNAIDSSARQQKDFSFHQTLDYKRDLASTFIRDNPSSIVSLQLLRDYYYQVMGVNDSIYYSLARSLDTTVQKSPYALDMLKEAKAHYLTAIGSKAPLLHIPGISGQIFPLYQTGQYTLLDFWASWCAPCRKENPALAKLFEKYHAAGFNITGISLDASRALWLKAIKQDKLSWQQLSDLKGWHGSTAELYGIKSIPMNYLVNRDGTIIAKNLYAKELESILSKLLAKEVGQD